MALRHTHCTSSLAVLLKKISALCATSVKIVCLFFRKKFIIGDLNGYQCREDWWIWANWMMYFLLVRSYLEPFRFLKITGLESLPFGYVGIIYKYMTSGQEHFSCFWGSEKAIALHSLDRQGPGPSISNKICNAFRCDSVLQCVDASYRQGRCWRTATIQSYHSAFHMVLLHDCFRLFHKFPRDPREPSQISAAEQWVAVEVNLESWFDRKYKTFRNQRHKFHSTSSNSHSLPVVHHSVG